MRPRFRLAAPLALVLATAAACVPASGEGSDSTVTDSLVAMARARLDSVGPADSLLAGRTFAAAPRGRAITQRFDWVGVDDTVARALVFAPATQEWYLAAVRERRLLVDVGRVDVDVNGKRAPVRLASLRRVAAALSPVAKGARFRLRGPWGDAEATVSGFDAWNGRVVATLQLPAAVDSAARATPSLVVAAELIAGAPVAADPVRAATDSSGVAAADSAAVAGAIAPAACVRDSVPAPLLARADTVRDSIEVVMRERQMPKLPRLAKVAKVQHARVAGCFGAGRVVQTVSVRAGDEWIQERVVVIDSTGRATPLAVRDYRFKAHQELRAIDADGDGVDDVSAKGVGQAIGGTVVLRLDPAARRLERLASGFAWERR